jgi:hypothetical protein
LEEVLLVSPSDFQGHYPHCNVVGCYETFASGNTLRGTYYTDGKAVFPMLKQVPEVMQCPGCKRPYWLWLATEMGEFDRWGTADVDQHGMPINPHFRDVPVLAEPNESEYLSGIADLIRAKPTDELTVRLLAWWSGNDRYRLDEPDYIPEPAPADLPQLAAMRRANIDGLLKILPDVDADDPSRPLMRAEVFRQIGEFDRALELLARPYPQEFAEAVMRLSALCKDRDTALRTL